MSAAMVKQTHIEVRRHCGRAHIATRMRAIEPHKRATRRRELIRSAAITTTVLLIASACALFLTTNPL